MVRGRKGHRPRPPICLRRRYTNLYRCGGIESLNPRMPDPPLRQPPSTTELAGSRRYRLWPVYAAAFTRTLSYTIYGLALPNYLIYFLHVPAGMLGVIISIYSIAYIAGPLVAMSLTRRIGARNGTLISVVARSCSSPASWSCSTRGARRASCRGRLPPRVFLAEPSDGGVELAAGRPR